MTQDRPPIRSVWISALTCAVSLMLVSEGTKTAFAFDPSLPTQATFSGTVPSADAAEDLQDHARRWVGRLSAMVAAAKEERALISRRGTKERAVREQYARVISDLANAQAGLQALAARAPETVGQPYRTSFAAAEEKARKAMAAMALARRAAQDLGPDEAETPTDPAPQLAMAQHAQSDVDLIEPSGSASEAVPEPADQPVSVSNRRAQDDTIIGAAVEGGTILASLPPASGWASADGTDGGLETPESDQSIPSEGSASQSGSLVQDSQEEWIQALDKHLADVPRLQAQLAALRMAPLRVPDPIAARRLMVTAQLLEQAEQGFAWSRETVSRLPQTTVEIASVDPVLLPTVAADEALLAVRLRIEQAVAQMERAETLMRRQRYLIRYGQ